ncbi:hypothetical protein M422DRAFT_29714 [Sphaerobolus stellatus SS14]|uniref:Unplaced genomic scaffold SPHSTscaffold_36, whole genome shotgun sequence n=1 Tax=Sphaerobolus stellatus (strain SS14) TaxID=990650 RepID=A0A0C9W1Y6_SPHS4|nr:hypothetical protein M422DRAFT_29714 [Sphaerobolus stellatus SS14]
MSTIRSFIVPLLALLWHASLTTAQLVNGQYFTKGLAISDAPAPSSDIHAGSGLTIALDLSGDGKLSQDAFLPTSNAATAYQSLNLFLVSSQTDVNITVSVDALLTQESGSTVKHLNWPIPTCLPQGNYNLTIYELSRIGGKSYFSITPIPLNLLSSSKSKTTCPSSSNITEPQTQPQASSPFAASSPWLQPSTTTMVVTSTQVDTTTVNGVQTIVTIPTTWTTVSTSNVFPTDGTFFPVNGATPLMVSKVALIPVLGLLLVWWM